MSREIKFRAWNTVRAEYLSAGNVFIAIEPGKNPALNPVYLDLIRHPDLYRERFIIEQFTGRRDKNWKEVYEGDRLKVFYQGHEYEVEVIFENAAFRPKMEVRPPWLDTEWPIYNEAMEVIGNIHEKAQR